MTQEERDKLLEEFRTASVEAENATFALEDAIAVAFPTDHPLVVKAGEAAARRAQKLLEVLHAGITVSGR